MLFPLPTLRNSRRLNIHTQADRQLIRGSTRARKRRAAAAALSSKRRPLRRQPSFRGSLEEGTSSEAGLGTARPFGSALESTSPITLAPRKSSTSDDGLRSHQEDWPSPRSHRRHHAAPICLIVGRRSDRQFHLLTDPRTGASACRAMATRAARRAARVTQVPRSSGGRYRTRVLATDEPKRRGPSQAQAPYFAMTDLHNEVAFLPCVMSVGRAERGTVTSTSILHEARLSATTLRVVNQEVSVRCPEW